jgi:solute carrier family 25 (mitochondrial uncoupling protein), member 27
MNDSFKKLFLIQTSACIAETTTYPIDYIKTRMQINSQKVSSFDVIKKLSKEPLQMYDGLKPALLRHCIYTMLRVNIYESLRDSNKNDKSISKKYIIGGLSGGISQLIASPCDLLKIRYITNKNHTTIPKTIKNIYSENGIRGLWKGVLPNVSRAMLVNLGELATYDHVKCNIKENLNISESTFLHILSSICSGFVASVCCTPADVVKSRMMQDNSPYKGVIDCLHKTIKKEGIQSMYKGFFPIWIRLAPWQLTFWVSYEKLRILSGLESF